jgi:hypothetical protein
MRDLLTDLMVNTDKFDQGHMQFFEDVEEEEKEERLKVYRDSKTWNLEIEGE